MKTYSLIALVALFYSFTCIVDYSDFQREFVDNKQLTDANIYEELSDKDFSAIWSKENSAVLGTIGKNNKRIKIKLSKVKKVTGPKGGPLYNVVGAFNYLDTVYPFSGSIDIKCAQKYKKLHFGVDSIYFNSKIIEQGVLMSRCFLEGKNITLEGNLYSKWLVDSTGKVQYDDIELTSDSYNNNAFIGTVKLNNRLYNCSWGDRRVPNAPKDFDIGAGEFSPSDKYVFADSVSKCSWYNYSKAYFFNDSAAKRIEKEKWWNHSK